MGTELDKELQDNELRQDLHQLQSCINRIKARIQEAEGIMEKVKPDLETAGKTALVAELETELTGLKKVTETWT
jgi:SMC interacting uncharacterized protein involved in chromosome segregation